MLEARSRETGRHKSKFFNWVHPRTSQRIISRYIYRMLEITNFKKMFVMLPNPNSFAYLLFISYQQFLFEHAMLGKAHSLLLKLICYMNFFCDIFSCDVIERHRSNFLIDWLRHQRLGQCGERCKGGFSMRGTREGQYQISCHISAQNYTLQMMIRSECSEFLR